jgi:hypothetical protein
MLASDPGKVLDAALLLAVVAAVHMHQDADLQACPAHGGKPCCVHSATIQLSSANQKLMHGAVPTLHTGPEDSQGCRLHQRYQCSRG